MHHRPGRNAKGTCQLGEGILDGGADRTRTGVAAQKGHQRPGEHEINRKLRQQIRRRLLDLRVRRRHCPTCDARAFWPAATETGSVAASSSAVTADTSVPVRPAR